MLDVVLSGKVIDILFLLGAELTAHKPARGFLTVTVKSFTSGNYGRNI